MKFYIISFFLILFFYCSSDSKMDTEVNKFSEKIDLIDSSEFLSLEMTFGTEKYGTKDEFLLVGPSSICVNDEGDIIVFDERSIKVYDEYGKGKKIFGRPGQGPGEFAIFPALSLGPEGYLMVLDPPFSGGSGTSYYNLFAPDYTFVEKRKFRSSPHFEEYLKTQGLEFNNIGYITQSAAVNKYEKIYDIIFRKQLPESTKFEYTQYRLLIFEKEDFIIPLINVKDPSYYSYSNGRGGVGARIGNIAWVLIYNRSIIYVNTDEDKHDEKNGSQYTIHLLSLDTLEDKKIDRKFTPVTWSEYFAVHTGETRKISTPTGREISLNAKERNKEFFEERKYYPSVSYMTSDRNHVFIFDWGENVKKETRVDVFDVDTEKFIGQFNFPKPLLTIKNGYAYESGIDEEGFAEIRKYKINQAVYGK